MAIIRNNKISTTFKYVKIEANAELSLGPIEWEYSDGTKASVKTTSSTSNVEDRRKIRRSEGCFITKQPGYTLENAHFINAVRNDPDRKKIVEKYLVQLGVVDAKFGLNDVSNLAPLDRNLHYALDKLGFFAITCAENTLTALIALVDKENKRCQRSTGEYTREFDFKKPPFTDAQYELVVLYPDHFLPRNGNALAVFTEHGNDLSWKMYVVSPDGALREGRDNAQPLLPPFASNRGRKNKKILNPFLVVLNAEMAFRRFKLNSTLCQHYQKLVDLTIDLADKIYYKPLIDYWKQRLSMHIHQPSPGDGSSDVEMEEAGSGEEFGVKKADNDKTITQRAIGKRSGRMRAVVNEPVPGASSDIGDNHEDIFPGLDVLANSHEQVNTVEKVQQWRVTAF